MTEKEQHYFEILLEDIKHSVETIAEGYTVLDSKIDRFHKESKDDHRLVMGLLQFSHDELKKEIQSVDKRSEDRDAELRAILTDVDKRSEARDAELQAILTAEIQDVDKRSEARDAELQAILTADVQNMRTELSAKIEAVGSKVEGHEDRIRFLERKTA